MMAGVGGVLVVLAAAALLWPWLAAGPVALLGIWLGTSLLVAAGRARGRTAGGPSDPSEGPGLG